MVHNEDLVLWTVSSLNTGTRIKIPNFYHNVSSVSSERCTKSKGTRDVRVYHVHIVGVSILQ